MHSNSVNTELECFFYNQIRTDKKTHPTPVQTPELIDKMYLKGTKNARSNQINTGTPEYRPIK
jgi:hypothetical protein